MIDLIGQQLGNYTLAEVIGRGGMATIYRAQVEPVARDVAVKVLAVELAGDRDFTHRFRREAAVVAQMEHPHILRVLDFGEQGPYVYIVMPLITGGDLHDEMRQGPLSLNRAARVLSQIASALTYAHTQGIVHRDLKPENVLLDEQRNAYLTDFGIAKMMAGTSHITATGMLMGTPAYMAPEQWRTEPIDGRTDVYALGMMLYEMLVGIQPFEADSPFALMYEHLDKMPTSPLRYHPNLPAAVEPVIYKAIAKTPEQRYPTPTALAEAFTSVVTRAPNPTQRLSPPKKRLPPQQEGLQTELDKSTLDMPVVPEDQLPEWARKLKGAPQVSRAETPPSSPTPSHAALFEPTEMPPSPASPPLAAPDLSFSPPTPPTGKRPSLPSAEYFAPPPAATIPRPRRRTTGLLAVLGGLAALIFIAVIAITALLLLQDGGDDNEAESLSAAQQTGTASGAMIADTATATSTPQATPLATDTPFPTASPTPFPTATDDEAEIITILVTPSPTLTATPTILPTNTPKPTLSPAPTVSPSPAPTGTPTQPPTNTPKPTATPDAEETRQAQLALTPVTPIPTNTHQPTATPTTSPPTATFTLTATFTPPATDTLTPSIAPTEASLPTATFTLAATDTPEPTLTPTLPPPPTATPTVEPTRDVTATSPPTLTPAVTATPQLAATPQACMASPSGGGAVNLRTGPGGGFAVLDRLLPGESLPVLLRTTGGYAYLYNGWADETVIDLSPASACANVPVIRARAAGTAAACTIRAAQDYADLRVEPSPLADRAYLEMRNTRLTVFRVVTGADGLVWYYAATDDADWHFGWMPAAHAEALTACPPPEDVDPTAVDTVIATPEPVATADAATPECYLETTTATALNVRYGPGIGFGVADQLLPGVAYPVLLRSYTGWAYVGMGWVDDNYVRYQPEDCAPIVAEESLTAQEICGIVVTNAVGDLRTQADPGADRMYLVTSGVRLSVFRVATGVDGQVWYYAVTNDGNFWFGWMPAAHVRTLTTCPAPE